MWGNNGATRITSTNFAVKEEAVRREGGRGEGGGGGAYRRP